MLQKGLQNVFSKIISLYEFYENVPSYYGPVNFAIGIVAY